MKKVLFVLALAACGGRESSTTPSNPRFGLAVSDTTGAWCAEFKNDSTRPAIQPGDQVMIVFPGPPTATLAARVRAPRSTECWAAFPQPRWIDYTAYDLELERPRSAGAQVPTVGLIARGQLDGLETRRCTADEGEHFTVWTAGEGQSRRIWHEYYDWGAFTDPTCGPGENGEP